MSEREFFTHVLLAKIEDKECHQADIATTYSAAISIEGMPWGAINNAIICRWSISGLNRIKTMAWKERETRRIT
jgi:hypothetical protein